MKYWIHNLCCGAALLGLAGCALLRPLDPDTDIQGVWRSVESVAVYEITNIDGVLQVKGHSSYSGKEMIIRDVFWDGSVLRFTSYLPSTDRKVIHENRLLDATTMKSRVEIQSRMDSTLLGETAHELIWKKDNTEPAARNASTSRKPDQ